MLLNNDEKIVEKMIRVIIIALVTAMLSALYISKVQAADVVPNEILMPDSLHDQATESFNPVFSYRSKKEREAKTLKLEAL